MDGVIRTDTLPEGVKQKSITREAHALGVKLGNSKEARRQVEEKPILRKCRKITAAIASGKSPEIQ